MYCQFSILIYENKNVKIFFVNHNNKRLLFHDCSMFAKHKPLSNEHVYISRFQKSLNQICLI